MPPTAEAIVRAAVSSPGALTVLYDEDCALCIRCRHWLERQSTYVPLSFEPAGSAEVRERYETQLPWLGYDLVVISDRGEVWIGPAAFLMCLWATRQYREWSFRLSGRSLAPLAERFFHLVSARRRFLAQMLGTPECEDERCRHRR